MLSRETARRRTVPPARRPADQPATRSRVPTMEDDEYAEGMEVGCGEHHGGGGHAAYSGEVDDEVGYGGGGDVVEMKEDGNGDGDLPDEQEITHGDARAVIPAYFEEKGLVGQQLDYLDEFIQNTMKTS